MSILRVKDDQGNYVEIPAIKGEPGASGVIDATTESALTGLLKGAGGHIAPAVAGTDYVAPADMAAKQNKITVSGLLKGDGAGGITAAVAGTDYVEMESGTWTPQAGYDNLNITSAPYGKYIKIGKFVLITLSISGTLTGNDDFIEISNLPFFPSGMSIGRVSSFKTTSSWANSIPTNLLPSAYGIEGTDVPDTKNIEFVYVDSTGKSNILKASYLLQPNSTASVVISTTLLYETNE